MTEERAPNIERIRQVVALIEEDEQKHDGQHFDMRDWVTPPEDRGVPAFCNTSMCFAGWAVVAESGGMKSFLARALEQDQDGEWWTTPWGLNVEDVSNDYLGFTGFQGAAIYEDTRIATSEELKQRITDVLQTEIWEGFTPVPLGVYEG